MGNELRASPKPVYISFTLSMKEKEQAEQQFSDVKPVSSAQGKYKEDIVEIMSTIRNFYSVYNKIKYKFFSSKD